MKKESSQSDGKPASGASGKPRQDEALLSWSPRRSLQPGLSGGLGVERVPVLPENREYLKALRQAELTAWKSAGADCKHAAVPASPRLPIRDHNRAEGRLYALLFVLCSVTLLSVLRGLWHSAPRWHAFTELVRLLVG